MLKSNDLTFTSWWQTGRAVDFDGQSSRTPGGCSGHLPLRFWLFKISQAPSWPRLFSSGWKQIQLQNFHLSILWERGKHSSFIITSPLRILKSLPKNRAYQSNRSALKEVGNRRSSVFSQGISAPGRAGESVPSWLRRWLDHSKSLSPRFYNNLSTHFF